MFVRMKIGAYKGQVREVLFDVGHDLILAGSAEKFSFDPPADRPLPLPAFDPAFDPDAIDPGKTPAGYRAKAESLKPAPPPAPSQSENPGRLIREFGRKKKK
jgi:hypothetical protein